jgi:hypothetical protein
MMTSMRESDSDERMLGQIADTCRWYAAARPPAAQRRATALTTLAQISGGRTDLLARYAGQSLAWYDTQPDAPAHQTAAQLCIDAGADMSLIEQWHHQYRPRSGARNQPAPLPVTVTMRSPNLPRIRSEIPQIADSGVCPENCINCVGHAESPFWRVTRH